MANYIANANTLPCGHKTQYPLRVTGYQMCGPYPSKAFTGRDPNLQCNECLLLQIKDRAQTSDTKPISSSLGSSKESRSFQDFKVKRKPVNSPSSNVPQPKQITRKSAPAATFDHEVNKLETHQVVICLPMKKYTPQDVRVVTIGKPKANDLSTLPSQLQAKPVQRTVLRASRPKALRLSKPVNHAKNIPAMLRIRIPDDALIPEVGLSISATPPSTSMAETTKLDLQSALQIDVSHPSETGSMPETAKIVLPSCLQIGVPTSSGSGSMAEATKLTPQSILQSKSLPNYTYRPYITLNPMQSTTLTPQAQAYKPYRAPKSFDEILESIAPDSERQSTTSPTVSSSSSESTITTNSGNNFLRSNPQESAHLHGSFPAPAYVQEAYQAFEYLQSMIKLSIESSTTADNIKTSPPSNSQDQAPLHNCASSPYAQEAYQAFEYIQSMIRSLTAPPASLLSSTSRGEGRVLDQAEMDAGFKSVGSDEGVATFVPAEVRADDLWEDVDLSSPAPVKRSAMGYGTANLEGGRAPLEKQEGRRR
ncbi:hypothetical protein GLAREA_12269 [Glarea lozoyensis ATCC 20868]|uniref:Uncharacterized protein n=1 Tax=Glarea lozoyensis (strain ATCC 20868 / MF5171) TaxID=1116229 RepID=S3DYT2_GLAL2|nr:uncharacterized protein GLAREA_12269 [Glarea lozoyensis ATCC 20868]EPE31513.1 hypothetical protein GLAREA_12269 [Glarea lozoyensis ATCC 20868]